MVRHVAGYLCHDCKQVAYDAPGVRGLPRGEWRVVAGVRRFVPDPIPTTGRPRKPARYQWSAEEAKAAHSDYVRGIRNDWSIEGERMYSRWAKARQKAARETRQEAA